MERAPLSISLELSSSSSPHIPFCLVFSWISYSSISRWGLFLFHFALMCVVVRKCGHDVARIRPRHVQRNSYTRGKEETFVDDEPSPLTLQHCNPCCLHCLFLQCKRNKQKPINKILRVIYMSVLYTVWVSWYSPSLHERTALGSILSDGGGLLQDLSPWRLLGYPLEAPPWAGAFELWHRPMDARHGRQRGDVEHVPDTVLRVLGGALCVGHSPYLPGQTGALETRKPQNCQ